MASLKCANGIDFADENVATDGPERGGAALADLREISHLISSICRLREISDSAGVVCASCTVVLAVAL